MKAKNNATHGLKYEEAPITPKKQKKPVERKETGKADDFQPMTQLEMIRDNYKTRKNELNSEIRKRKQQIKELRLLKKLARQEYRTAKTRAKIDQID